MIILFRKNGIDILFFENYTSEVTIRCKNKLSFSVKEIKRNYYNECKVNLHLKIKMIAYYFDKNKDNIFIDLINQTDGKRYQDNPSYHQKESYFSKEAIELRRELKEGNSWRDAFKECGYVHDGLWLKDF